MDSDMTPAVIFLVSDKLSRSIITTFIWRAQSSGFSSNYTGSLTVNQSEMEGYGSGEEKGDNARKGNKKRVGKENKTRKGTKLSNANKNVIE